MSQVVLFICFLSLMNVAVSAKDQLFVNAQIRTMRPAEKFAEAMLVRGDRIVAVGRRADVEKLAGPSVETTDLGGKIVLPGFIDLHVHFMSVGVQLVAPQLRNLSTSDEITSKIEFSTRFVPDGRWIIASGWNQTTVPIDENALNQITTSQPVFILDATGTAAVANSLARKLAGIPESGADRTNAILRGDELRRMRRVVPTDFLQDYELLAETASNHAAAFGVTSVNEVSADDLTPVYQRLAASGKLKTRIRDCYSLHLPPEKIPSGTIRESLVRRDCVKGTSDGDPESDEELFREVLAADRRGEQVAIHAIGDNEVRQVVRVFVRVARRNGPRDRRFRIEHARPIPPSLYPQIKKYGIIASLQPALFTNKSGQTIEPLATLTRAGLRLGFGSDASMIPINPFDGIAAAVENVNPRENIAMDDALRLYSAASAYAEFSETEKGSLESGKLADFIVLDSDPFTLNAAEIRKTRVARTYVGGRLVFWR